MPVAHFFSLGNQVLATFIFLGSLSRLQQWDFGVIKRVGERKIHPTRLLHVLHQSFHGYKSLGTKGPWLKCKCGFGGKHRNPSLPINPFGKNSSTEQLANKWHLQRIHPGWSSLRVVAKEKRAEGNQELIGCYYAPGTGLRRFTFVIPFNF